MFHGFVGVGSRIRLLVELKQTHLGRTTTMKAKHVLVLLVGIMATSLFVTGCGNSDSDGASGASILGSWAWSKMVINGVTINMANPAASTVGGSTTITPQWITQIAASEGTPGASIVLTVVFNADGTVTGSVVASAPGEKTETIPASGTWSVAGDRLTLAVTTEGTTVSVTGTYAVTSSKLTISMSNADIMQVLNANGATASKIPAQYRQLLNSLSGSVEFTR